MSIFEQPKGNNHIKINNSQYYRSMIDYRVEACIIVNNDGIILLVNSKTLETLKVNQQDIEFKNIEQLFFVDKEEDNLLKRKPFRDFEQSVSAVDGDGIMHRFLLNLKEIEGSYYLCSFKDNDKPEPKNENIEHKFSIEEKSIGNLIDNSNNDNEVEIRNHLNTLIGMASALSAEETIKNNNTLKLYVDAIVSRAGGLKKMLLNCEDTDVDLAFTTESLSKLIFKVQVITNSFATENYVKVVIPDNQEDVQIVTDSTVLVDVVETLVKKAIAVSRSMNVKIDYEEDEKGYINIIIDNIGMEFPSEILSYIDNNDDYYDIGHFIFESHPDFLRFFKNLEMINARIKIKESDSFEQVAIISLPGKNIYNNLENIKNNSIPKKKALIVEDDKMNAIILGHLIEEQYQVTKAYSGNEALNIIGLYHKKDIVFDIVFMDIGLPKPWDGITLRAEILRRWPEYKSVSFIAQSAFTKGEYAEKIENAGFNMFITKPISKNDILRVLKQNMKKK